MAGLIENLTPVLEKIDWEWWQITIFVFVVIWAWNQPKRRRIANEKLKITRKFDAVEAKADRDMEKVKLKRAAKAIAKQKKEKRN